MTRKRGLLIVISGPSGVGKDTLIEHLLKLDQNLRYSISYTTRAQRAHEVDEVNYRFVSRDQFERLIEQGALLEHATYNANLYGTPAVPVEEARAAGHDIVLKIEVQGARLVRRHAEDGLFIFLAPPSTEELVRRQELRRSESRKDMAERLRIADKEMTYAPDYDFVVVNDELDRAVAEALAIIHQAREGQT